MIRFLLNPSLWWISSLVWGVLALASLAWNFRAIDHGVQQLAASKARIVFKVVDSMRLWNARHGGLYVLKKDGASKATGAPPDELSLIIPSDMTREIAATLAEADEIQIRLTSLLPLNPDNRADNWETAALKEFESSGRTERFSLFANDARVRFMGAIRVQEPCLRCHAQEGYRAGDIRGGMSITFPVNELQAGAKREKGRVLDFHVLAWILLSTATLGILGRTRADVRALSKNAQASEESPRDAQLRKQLQEHEAAEARLRMMIESSGDGIYGVDLEGRVTFINSTALRLLGYENAEQVIGRNAHEAWHRDPADETRAQEEHCRLASTLHDGAHIHGEDETFWRADGTAFSVEYRVQPLVVDGRITGAIVNFDDITERKEKEQELRKLSNAVDHSPESVIITDADGVIEYVNRKFVETTGYAPEEVIGRKPSLLKSGQTRPEVYTELWETITSGQVWQGAILNRRRNGELFWEEESISPITDAKGNITHFVGVKEDITERRRLEEKIWRQANYDTLTELPNRRLFYDRLEQAIAAALRTGKPVGLMFIDLDHFKEVNDTFGHTAGDELLREASRRLLQSVRRSDTVARMGGDEFTIILPSFDEGDESVASLAERVRSALAQPFKIEPRAVTISASIGVVVYPHDGDSIEVLLKNADIAMYRAKAGGRNAVEFFGTAFKPH